MQYIYIFFYTNVHNIMYIQQWFRTVNKNVMSWTDFESEE